MAQCTKPIKINFLYLTLNPYPAVHVNPYLCKQCRSRSEAIWSGSTLFVIQFVNLNENIIWYDLIGWYSEMGVAN